MYCENDLYVYCGRQDRRRAEHLLQEFAAAVWGSDTMLDQRRVLGQDQPADWDQVTTEVSERIKGARVDDAAQWRPIEDVRLERDRVKHRLVYHFTTLAPPRELFTVLSDRFPRLGLCLEYFSRHMGFSGGIHRFPADHKPSLAEWHHEGYLGLRGLPSLEEPPDDSLPRGV